MDQIFLNGLEDIIKITYFDDMKDDTEDNDDDENKYTDIKTKDDNDIKDDNVVKIGRPLRMRRVTSSWSAGDFDALSKA